MCCPDPEQGSQPWTKPSKKGPPQRRPAQGLTRNPRVRFVSVCTKLDGPWIVPKQFFLLGWQKVPIQDTGFRIELLHSTTNWGILQAFFFSSFPFGSPVLGGLLGWPLPVGSFYSFGPVTGFAARRCPPPASPLPPKTPPPPPASTPGAVALSLPQHN